jgi:hypothetical protein
VDRGVRVRESLYGNAQDILVATSTACFDDYGRNFTVFFTAFKHDKESAAEEWADCRKVGGRLENVAIRTYQTRHQLATNMGKEGTA